MASPVKGTSLGENPLKIQGTFTWADLSRGYSSAAKKARAAWHRNRLPTEEEEHFFELNMASFMDGGKFSLVVSVRIVPYNYLVYSETTSMRAAVATDLATLAMAYLEGLFGVALTKRAVRRYGGRILGWLESVATIYEQGEEF